MYVQGNLSAELLDYFHSVLCFWIFPEYDGVTITIGIKIQGSSAISYVHFW